MVSLDTICRAPLHRCFERMLVVLLLAPFACSSATEPSSALTVLVTNATCHAGQCTPLEIVGFLIYQPVYTPGGPWSFDLGLVSGPSACLTFPPSATFRVGDASTGATTTYTWTTADSLALGALEPGTHRLQASPSASAFVPASAPGWRITFPGETAVTATQACTP